MIDLTYLDSDERHLTLGDIYGAILDNGMNDLTVVLTKRQLVQAHSLLNSSRGEPRFEKGAFTCRGLRFQLEEAAR